VVTAASERRRRTLAMFATTLVVVILIPLLGYVGARAVLDSTGGKDGSKGNLPVVPLPVTPTAAMLGVDADGKLASITVFVLAGAGTGGSIVPVPVTSDIGFADDARRSIQQVYAEDGLDATLVQLESLLLISIDVHSVAQQSDIAGILLPFQPYQVRLVAPVEAENQDDAIAAGDVVLDSVAASQVLTTATGSSTSAERYENAEEVWQGVATSVGEGRPLVETPTGAPADVDALLARLFAGTVRSRGLATAAFDEVSNPTGLDVIALDDGDVVFVFATIAPGSMSAPKIGPVLRVEAPPGYDAQVKRTIDRLLYVGGNVISVDMTGAPQPTTVFYVPDAADRLRVGIADGIFGTINFGEPTVRIEGVDVTVVLGTDYLQRPDT
jgi:hypothetical protein